MQFHICHVFPEGRVYHGLNGYAEIIETLRWGLEALGHGASYGRNQTRAKATNIIFGAQMLHVDQLDEIPAGSIIYNLEQMARVPVQDIRRVMHALAKRFQIWDYCDANLPTWEAIGTLHQPCWVGIGWAPVLSRIPKASPQDIDVLLYGTPSAERNRLFEAVALAGLRCAFVSGIYGAERDALIARSKVILNGSIYTVSRIFEIARVSYLLANAKAVVADLHPTTLIEPDIRSSICATNRQSVRSDCERLVDDVGARTELEELAQTAFQARDIRAYLEAPINQLHS